MTKILAVINQKGGVGKTTTASELAYLLGEKYKTLAIDLDAQRNFSMYNEADLDAPGIYEVLNAELLLSDAVQHVKTFDLLTASKKLADSAKEFGEPDDVFLLGDVLEGSDYDFVVIDSAPARSPLLYMTYLAADYIIPVTECDDGSIEGIREVYTDMTRFKRWPQFHAKILGILMTKYEKTSMHQIALEELSQIAAEIGTSLFDTKIRKSIVVSESKTARLSINEYERWNNASVDYRNVIKEIEQRIEGGR